MKIKVLYNNDIMIITLNLPLALFIAQRPSKQLKQIIQIEHSILKNPNWPEANKLSMNKHSQGFELGSAVKQIQLVVMGGIKPGTSRLRVRCADNLATLPP